MSEELNGQVQQQQQQPGENEDRARRMGWVPKDEFRGDPDKWVDAERFVERADSELPVMRENLKRMERKYQQMERTLSEFREYASKSEQRSYERALQQIKAEQRKAVEEADVERYEAAQKQYESIQKELSEKQRGPQELPPEFVEWKAENTWYDRDAEMTEYANSQGQYLGRTKPHLVGAAFYAEVEKRVRLEFPEKFENPRRHAAGAVHGSPGENDTGSGGKRGKGYQDLPADAKAACDRFVKNIPGYTREQYLKDYAWS